MIGQMNIFDYMKSQEPVSEPPIPPILLKTGQKVFLVTKGDVEPYIVLDETWLCEEDNQQRGYRMQRPNNGIYNVVWNESIGRNCFLEHQSACEVAEAYLNQNDVIRAENIKPIKTVAYSYVRKCDNREMIAFYSELDNGMVYIKEFYTYQHIVEADKKNKALKRFEAQWELKDNNAKQVEYKPVYKNMYRVRQKDDWDYAEANYGK